MVYSGCGYMILDIIVHIMFYVLIYMLICAQNLSPKQTIEETGKRALVPPVR